MDFKMKTQISALLSIALLASVIAIAMAPVSTAEIVDFDQSVQQPSNTASSIAEGDLLKDWEFTRSRGNRCHFGSPGVDI